MYASLVASSVVVACAGAPTAPARTGDAETAASAKVDRDHDDIPDVDDACPLVPGRADASPFANGCPGLVTIETIGDYIVEAIHFREGSAVIEKESTSILDAVATILKKAPKTKRVRIEGHASAHEKDAKELSERRAQAVLASLVAHGVTTPLIASGVGSALPLDDDDTELGREKNRRVEFRIEGPE
jgi:outer membrane protein OmpA-like peptidoglycan-associated protein